MRVTEKHYAPWVKARQDQLESDVRHTWGEEQVVVDQAKRRVHGGYTEPVSKPNWFILTTLSMVEAAGVEPASENVTGQKTTCLVTFLPQALPVGRSRLRLRTDKKPVTLACGSHPLNPGVVGKTSPLCDALPQPTSKAAEDGYLIN